MYAYPPGLRSPQCAEAGSGDGPASVRVPEHGRSTVASTPLRSRPRAGISHSDRVGGPGHGDASLGYVGLARTGHCRSRDADEGWLRRAGREAPVTHDVLTLELSQPRSAACGWWLRSDGAGAACWARRVWRSTWQVYRPSRSSGFCRLLRSASSRARSRSSRCRSPHPGRPDLRRAHGAQQSP